jgi:hypothetical protein
MRVSLRGEHVFHPRSRGFRGVANATIPLAELVLDDATLVVRLRYRWNRRIVGRFFPPVEIPLVGLRVEATGGWMTRGLFFNGSREDQAQSVIFWCRKATQEQVLDALRARGVKLDALPEVPLHSPGSPSRQTSLVFAHGVPRRDRDAL